MNWTFDVIVPTFDNARELSECLDGLEKQTFSSFRVLICIDGESPTVRQLLAQRRLPFPHEVLSHANHEHRGRNATRNLALPHITAPLVAMLDSDVVPAPTWLAEHYEFLRTSKCVSVGDIRYVNSHENVWARYIQHRGKNKYRHCDLIPYYYLTTGNVALPSRFYLELGGQDEQMTSYGGGDTEFALRLHKTFRVPVLFNTAALGYSAMNKTLAQALAQMEEFGRVNLPYIAVKHPDQHHIYGLRYLIGTRWIYRVIRRIAQTKLSSLFVGLLPLPFARLERMIVHFAVFSAIVRGWERHRFETLERATR